MKLIWNFIWADFICFRRVTLQQWSWFGTWFDLISYVLEESPFSSEADLEHDLIWFHMFQKIHPSAMKLIWNLIWFDLICFRRVTIQQWSWFGTWFDVIWYVLEESPFSNEADLEPDMIWFDMFWRGSL